MNAGVPAALLNVIYVDGRVIARAERKSRAPGYRLF